MEKATLITEIIELQQRVGRAMTQYEPDAWMEISLTIAQLKSLFFIANSGSINLRTLAAAQGVTPANVTGIVDRLVKQGLLSRTENPQDRRMLLLQVTGKGKALVNNLKERGIGRMSKVLGCMSLEELSTLARGLASLLRAAEAVEREVEDEHN